MSGKRSSGDDVPREETGWLDDLRKAKKSGDAIDRSDFTTGGTDRWAKLSALSDPDNSPPADVRPSRDTGRRSRARTPNEEGTSGGRPRQSRADAEPGGRRRAADEAPGGHRSPAPPEPSPEKLVGRRARPEPEPSPEKLVGRRARPEPEPSPEKLIGRRARPEPEPQPEKLVGRRARAEPERETGRHAPQSPAAPPRRREPDLEEPRRRSSFDIPDPISPASPRGGASRVDPATAGRSGAGRHDASPEEARRRALFGDRPAPAPAPSPPVSPAGDEPRRRSPFSERGSGPLNAEEPRRRSPFGERGDRGDRIDASAAAPPVGPPQEARPRRWPFGGDRQAPPIPPPSAPMSPAGGDSRRRSPFIDRGAPPAPAGPGQEEPRRRSPFAPGTPRGLKAPLAAEPEPIGPSRPLRSASVVLGSPASAGGPPLGAPGAARPTSSGPVRPNSPGAPTAPPGARPRAAGLAAAGQVIRGARSEVRRQLREQQRLRMWTLITLVVAVVGALPFYFVLQAATRDPVVTSLDALSVPAWAVVNKTDNITGSRWCLLDCRYRERTAESSKSIPDTAKAYREALLAAGWAPMINVPGCEPVDEAQLAEGIALDDHSCWRRDEFTLDLTVSDPPCKQENSRRGFGVPTPTPDVSGSPGATASAAPPAEECAGSVVHIKVFNAIDDIRLRYSPEPTVDPELENLTDTDLNPSPSATP